MDINNNKVNNIRSDIQPKQNKTRVKSDVQVREGDLTDTLNSYAYLGQSQIVHKKYTRPIPPDTPNGLDLSPEELRPIKLVENEPLEKKEAIKFLKELGYSDELISKIDINNPKVLITVSALKNMLNMYDENTRKEIIKDFSKSDDENKLDTINDNNNENIKYFNKDNFEILSKYCDVDIDNFTDFLSYINNNDEIFLEKLPIIAYVKGKVSRGDLIHRANYENITLKGAEIIKQINAYLPERERMSAGWGSCIGDEDLSNGNFDKYLALLSQFSKQKTFNIATCIPSYRSESIPQLNNKMELIDEILEKYPMDLGENNYDIDIIHELFQSDAPEKVQEFVNGLSKEAKAKGIEINNKYKDKLSTTQIIDICNAIYDKDYGEVDVDKVFNFIVTQNPDDINDIIDLIKIYKGTNHLSYYVDSYLTPPNGDYKSYNTLYSYRKKFLDKGLKCYTSNFDNIVRDKNASPLALQKIMDYELSHDMDFGYISPDFYTTEKGYYKFVLSSEFLKDTNNYYSDYNENKRKQFLGLGEAINNDEELEFVLDLLKQTKNDSNYYKRFNEDAGVVLEILKLYQEDKETTQTVLNMKDKDNYYIYSNLDSITDIVHSMQIDKAFTEEVLKLRKDASTKYVKEIVEAKQIDEEYTRELLTKENINQDEHKRTRKPFRLKPDQIKGYVECAQIDKNLTNKLLNKHFTNDYGEFAYYTTYLSTDDVKHIVELAQKDREIVDLIIDSNETNYKGEEFPRFRDTDANLIFKSITEENADFIKDLIKQKEIPDGWQREKFKYNSMDIRDYAEASKVDLELTKQLMSEKIKDRNRDYVRFNSNDIQRMVTLSQKGRKSLLVDLVNAKSDKYFGEGPRFSSDFITHFASCIKTDEEEKYFRTLLNEKITTSDEERYVYDANDLSILLRLRNEYGEENVEKYRKEKKADGRPVYHTAALSNILYAEKKMPEILDSVKERANYLYYGEVSTLERVAPEGKEFLSKLLSDKITLNGEANYRYDIGDIPEMAELCAKYGTDAVDELASEKDKNPKGRELIKYDTLDISNLLYVKENIPEWYDKIKLDIKEYRGDISSLIDDIKAKKERAEDMPVGKNTVDEMSKAEKRNMIAMIMKYKNQPMVNKLLTKNLLNLPFMPINDEEYENNMKALADSLKISLEPASETDIDRFNTVVKDIVNGDNQLQRFTELIPQLENRDMSETQKMLDKIRNSPDYTKLSDNDKKILIIATLLHNIDNESKSTQDSAFDAFFIAKQFNMSDEDAQKVYTLIDTSDTVSKFMSTSKKSTNFIDRGCNISGDERTDTFDLIALNLKEGNNFEMAKLLYSAKECEGLTRYFDKLLEHRINEIKANDFVLPQTGEDDYKAAAQEQTIKRDGETFNVQVVYAKDIPDLHAFIHTPDAAFTSGGSRLANFANFEAFATLNDDRIICTSYVSDKKNGPALQFKNGFIFNVGNENQYVGYGRDIYSHSRNKGQLVVEYYRDKGMQAKRNKGEKYQHRTMISEEIKKLLYGEEYDEKTCNADYVKRLDNIKLKLGNKPMTLENLEEIDSELAKVYREFLSRNATENSDWNRQILLRDDYYHNEVLVSNPKIIGIFTSDLNYLPKEYIQKAQKEGLPIVVFNSNASD